MTRLLLLLLLLSVTSRAMSQRERIYQLEERLMKGDKKALFEIAPYLDSKKEVIEFLGYHVLNTTESAVAKRIVAENSIFTDDELTITEKLSSADFLSFLNRNNSRITFNTLAAAFCITPPEQRTAVVEFRQLPDIKWSDTRSRFNELLQKEWVRDAGIDLLILSKDAKALLSIASELYKIRYRFNRHHFDEAEYIDLLKILTGVEIAVENEKKELTWHIDRAFYPEAAFNLLVYFSKNYSQFTWDEQAGHFINPNINSKKPSRAHELMYLLASEDDSTAMAAYTELTTLSPETVVPLAIEFQDADADANDALPIFAFKFLMQIPALTNYCNNNGVDFKGSQQLQADIKQLDSELPFAQRRALENKLINTLSLDEITAFEYWALIKEESWNLTYSAGRILDMFYSRNWNKLLNNETHLKLYLEKSFLYDRLGIIGICNNYLTKFTNNGSLAIEKLNQLQTDDPILAAQIAKAKSLCPVPLKKPHDTMKVNDANRDYQVKDFEKQVATISKIKNKETLQDKLSELLSKINYNQLGIALRRIQNIPISDDAKYEFMDRDWGFSFLLNFDTVTAVKSFLNLYDKFTEYELYSYLLDSAGIIYKHADGSLDYDKIFEILKYDVVMSFVGGGGGKQDQEVYAVIKLLELTHKTTLGYPKKLCNFDGIYSCDSFDRAKEWMEYLQNNGLLKLKHDEPVSFNYND